MNWDFVYRGEVERLDDGSRAALGASFARLSEGCTHYEIAGPSNGRIVTLVHGFSAAYFVWDPTFTTLTSAGMRVLRYDLYGRGFSDRPPLPNDLKLFLTQLRELLDELSIAQTDLVGLSMGGPISAAFAVQSPDRVRSLILVDPVGPEAVPLRRIYRALLLPGIGELVAGLAGSGPLARGVASDVFGATPPGDFEARYLQQMRFKGFKRSLLSSLRNGMVDGFPDAYKRLGSLGKPVLLIWGRDDPAVPLAQSKRLLELVPQAEFHVIDDTGHTPHYERPDLVNPLLFDFLHRT